MKVVFGLLACWTLQGCWNDEAEPPPSPPAQDMADAGASLPDGDAGPPLPEPDAAVEVVLPPPIPAEACSDDLTFVGGTVQPDYGSVEGLNAAAVDPEKPGAYAVFERAVTVPLEAEMRSAAGYDIRIEAGELPGTLYAPSNDQGASLAPGKFPLIVGAPGFLLGYDGYADYFRHFASHGFVVLGIQTRGSGAEAQHDKEALGTVQAITWLLETSDARDHVDAEKISTTGHSKGGKVSFFAAAIDPRIDIVFGWDPSNAGGPPCGLIAELTGSECNALPVAPNCLAEQAGNEKASGILQLMKAESFVFGVPADPLTNPTPEHNALNFYRGAPSPASLVYLNGGHAAWVSNGAASLFSNADIIRVTQAVQTAKLLRVFYGATGLEAYLPGGSYLPSQGDLVRQVATK